MLALVYNDDKYLKLFSEQLSPFDIQVKPWLEPDLGKLPKEFLEEKEILFVDGKSFFDLEIKLFLLCAQRIYEWVGQRTVFLALRYEQDKNKYTPVVCNQFDLVVNKEEEAIDCYTEAGFSLVPTELLKQVENLNIKSFFAREFKYALPFGGLYLESDNPNFCKLAKEKLSQERKAPLFLDRDNLLIYDEGYTIGTKVKTLDLADEYIAKANKEQRPVIVVSNQSGVARGFFDLILVGVTNQAVKEAFAKKKLYIDDFYVCPYHTSGKIEKYLHLSKLRKPEPGMLFQASQKYRLDFKNALMLGDNPETDNIHLPYLVSKILGKNAL